MFRTILLLTLIGVAATAAELQIHTPEQPFPADRITSVDAVSERQSGTLLVRFGNTGRWPSVTFNGPWDLSRFAQAEFELVNRENRSVLLEIMIYDDNAPHGWNNSVHCRVQLAPRETRKTVLPLTRKASAANGEALRGINHLPPGIPGEGGNARAIDASHATAITFCRASVPDPDCVEIRSIAFTGDYRHINTTKLFPLVDRFGQLRHEQWPGKIHDEADLRRSAEVEEADLIRRPDTPEFNCYGGWASGPQRNATGRFRTEKYQGKWQLVDPDGRLFFSLGINHIDPGSSDSFTPVTADRLKWFEELPTPNDWSANGAFYNVRRIYTGSYSGQTVPCFSFRKWNLFRKYGTQWAEHSAELAHRRLKSWGFNTIGNWSALAVIAKQRTVYTVGAALAGSNARVVGGGKWSIGKCFDPFDPQFPGYVEQALKGLVGAARSPWCLGIFFDNELYWDEEFGLTVLGSDASQPAKQHFIAGLKRKYVSAAALNQAWSTAFSGWDDLLDKPHKLTATQIAAARADLSQFDELLADAYFQTVRGSIRKLMPGTLYLGARFARVTPESFRAAARHCDVVSLNLYRRDLAGWNPPVAVDAPLLVGEFHFGATDRGTWGYGLRKSVDQAGRAADFTAYVESALKHPQFVGAHWYGYTDQPLTGRSFDGENYSIGFVNVADVPYPELVEAGRALSERLYRLRIAP